MTANTLTAFTAHTHTRTYLPTKNKVPRPVRTSHTLQSLPPSDRSVRCVNETRDPETTLLLQTTIVHGGTFNSHGGIVALRILTAGVECAVIHNTVLALNISGAPFHYFS